MKGRGHFVPFKERGRAHGHEETHRVAAPRIGEPIGEGTPTTHHILSELTTLFVLPLHTQLNKTLLDFGIDRRKQCPVNALLTDTLILANTGKKPLRVRLYYPYRSHKFSLLFNVPPVLKIKPLRPLAPLQGRTDSTHTCPPPLSNLSAATEKRKGNRC